MGPYGCSSTRIVALITQTHLKGNKTVSEKILNVLLPLACPPGKESTTSNAHPSDSQIDRDHLLR